MIVFKTFIILSLRVYDRFSIFFKFDFVTVRAKDFREFVQIIVTIAVFDNPGKTRQARRSIIRSFSKEREVNFL